MCHLRGSAAGPQKPGCLCQGRAPIQQPPPWAPSTLPTPTPEGPWHPGSTKVQQGPPGLTLCSGVLPTAAWLDCQSLPGDTRHCWGVLHWHPVKGQLLACWRQHGHHLGTGNGWHWGRAVTRLCHAKAVSYWIWLCHTTPCYVCYTVLCLAEHHRAISHCATQCQGSAHQAGGLVGG